MWNVPFHACALLKMLTWQVWHACNLPADQSPARHTIFCRHSPAAAQLHCLLLQQQQASAHPQWHPRQQPPRPLAAATSALLLAQQRSLQTEGWVQLGLLLQMVLLLHRLSGPLACS
jgi:hypothetical protein